MVGCAGLNSHTTAIPKSAQCLSGIQENFSPCIMDKRGFWIPGLACGSPGMTKQKKWLARNDETEEVARPE
ncbi:MAG TPA: hypothetical protein ENK53_08335 [Thiotrichales bacterium]|nr:hypothetical protein [Thiotrichales bacterium]